MRKRIGAIVALPMVIGLIASMMFAGSVTAAASKTAGITEPTTCHFNVSYTWSGLGGGQDLTANLIFYRYDMVTHAEVLINIDHIDHVAGSGGSMARTNWADTGQSTAHRYFTYAFLTNKNGRVIHNSDPTSYYLPTNGEVCS